MTARTYTDDTELFNRLGLDHFSFDDQEKHFLGEYRLPDYDNASINISVTCMPAQFWHFEIITEEGKEWEVETGSGALSHYWPSVVMFATGMMVAKEA